MTARLACETCEELIRGPCTHALTTTCPLCDTSCLYCGAIFATQWLLGYQYDPRTLAYRVAVDHATLRLEAARTRAARLALLLTTIVRRAAARGS